MPIPIGTLITAAGALAVVLGLVLLAARLARSTRLGSFGGFRPTLVRRLILQEAVPLDRARKLLIVRCDGRDLLLLTGGATDLNIGWLPDSGQSAGAQA